VLSLLPLLLACQEPFPVDRHDLVGFRIAAIEVEPTEDDTWVPRLAAVVDGKPYADGQPLLAWYWLEQAEDLDGIDALSEPDAVGPAPELELEPNRPVLALLARFGSEEQRSFVRLDEAARDPLAAGTRPERIRARSVPLEVDTLDEDSSSLEARRGLAPGDEVTTVPSGRALRLDALGVPGAGQVRWMATAGTFLELDGATTDWLASDLTLDDGEVETRADLTDQVVTFVGLSVGSGRARFAATDRIVTEENLAAHVWVEGRLLFGVDLDGPAYVTLQVDDLSPSGLTFVGPEPVDPPPADLEALEELDPGTSALSCFEPVDGPFDPNWLLELRCPRRELDGARVLVVPDAWRAEREAR